ncbi:MAG: hypothetical protein CVU36_17400 [Betaproteobacteria bacterium HGW-Betaproteobacteria-9]|nr:MAG: hypothetical protein CVU36_17400 [Betaproteobacteria bacterium HGW-Betaproteobacteria-9]
MKKPLLVIALSTVSLALCAVAGTALYRWLTEGDEVRCVANEFTFGCSTTLGHVLTWVGALAVAVAVYLWARFRDR